MSFNIRDGTFRDGENRWENRRGILFGVLREYDCDVVSLQEAYRFQIDQICTALPQYGWIGVGRDDGKDKGEHSAILYRKDELDVAEQGTFWLSDTPEKPGSITWGNAVTRVCTWGRFICKPSGKAFCVFNLHLDHISQLSREKSVVLLERRIAARQHSDPVIVTGDFNSGEDNPAIRYLTGRASLAMDREEPATAPFALIDTLWLLHPQEKEVGTFHEFKGGRAGEKIDFIFTVPGLRVLDAAILHDHFEGRYPSDHFPVMAKVSLPSATDATPASARSFWP